MGAETAGGPAPLEPLQGGEARGPGRRGALHRRLLTAALRAVYDLLTWLTGGWVPPVVSAAALVHDGGRVLAIERSDRLGFSLPGGVVKSTETVEAALRREVEEETGFAVEIQDLFGVYSGNARDPRFSTVSIVYSAAIAGGRSRDSAEGRVCWLDLRHPPPDLAFDLEDVLQDFLSTLDR